MAKETTEFRSIIYLQEILEKLETLMYQDNILDPAILYSLENEIEDRQDSFLDRYYPKEYSAWRDIEGEDDLFYIWDKFLQMKKG